MFRFSRVVWLAALVPAAGCMEGGRSGGTQVSRLWAKPKPVQPSAVPPKAAPPSRRGAEADRSDAAPDPRPAIPSSSRAARTAAGDAIAYVDGVPVTRARVLDFLLKSHGIAVLEQIIVLDRAEREGAKRGISLNQRGIDAEYDRWLRNLTNPELAGVVAPDAPLDRAEGERLLERVLALRNISRAEYMAGVQRNAWLRAIAEHDVQLDDESLEREYRTAYGERVVARHIQLATAADAERVALEAADPGADFADLARRNSANPDTASSGGMLRPFSRDDPDVPDALRRAAFALESGRCSPPVRIGEWHHVIKVEERIPADDAGFASVREELTARLRRRQSEPAMQKLHQQLLDSAKVEIADPALAEEYGKKHPAFAGTKRGK